MRLTTAAWMVLLSTSSHAAELSPSTFQWTTANPEMVISTTDISTKLSLAYLQYNCDKSDKQKDPEYCARVKAADSILGKRGGAQKILNAQEDFIAAIAGALETTPKLESAVQSAREVDTARYGSMSAPTILRDLSPMFDYALDPKSKTPPAPY